jgi:molybdate transport system ATP-binding protein
VSGTGAAPAGTAAVALFRPTAVAIHLDPPHASPRNLIPVIIAEMEINETTVRVRGADQPDGSTGLAADVTAAAAADLDLAPGQHVYFVVKTHEIDLLSALPQAARARFPGLT